MKPTREEVLEALKEGNAYDLDVWCALHVMQWETIGYTTPYKTVKTDGCLVTSESGRSLDPRYFGTRPHWSTPISWRPSENANDTATVRKKIGELRSLIFNDELLAILDEVDPPKNTTCLIHSDDVWRMINATTAQQVAAAILAVIGE